MKQDQKKLGFTLLEVIIAMAIMVITFTAILWVEQGSIRAADRAQKMLIVSMLARNQIIETEYKIANQSFQEIRKEEKGQCPAPYQDYQWKTVIRDIQLPVLTPSNPSTSQNGQLEMIQKILLKILNKTIREITVSILWQRGGQEQSFSLSTYWVDLAQPMLLDL